jgi:hypothetical protein
VHNAAAVLAAAALAATVPAGAAQPQAYCDRISQALPGVSTAHCQAQRIQIVFEEVMPNDAKMERAWKTCLVSVGWNVAEGKMATPGLARCNLTGCSGYECHITPQKDTAMTFSLITRIQNLFPTPRTNEVELEVRNGAVSKAQQKSAPPEPRAQQGFFHAFIAKLFSRVCSNLLSGISVQRATKRSVEEMRGAAALKETMQAMQRKDVSQTKTCLKKLQLVLGSTNADQSMIQLVNACLLQNGKNGVDALKLVLSVCENSPWESVKANSDENELERLYSNLAKTFEGEWAKMFQYPPDAWRTRRSGSPI